MAYKSIKHTPKTLSNGDVKVIVRITGLFGSEGSEYEEYKVVTYRDKMKCFICWEYNSNGEFVSVTYNDSSKKQSVGEAIVTHWDYLKEIPVKWQ